ncbi:hypothetical protein [Actinomadura litoris]|uniref:hypothetical protein n=1 Tax=Actinomadura litoris TaxID=2678616 RepID=UPI001FA6F3BF|nr:hypothetical protein [Actinomadura litoris]
MSGYHEILLAASAVRTVRAIHRDDPGSAEFVLNSLEYLSTDVDSGALRTIDKEAGLLTTRIGDFDALCWLRQGEMSIVVLAVSRRRHPA